LPMARDGRTRVAAIVEGDSRHAEWGHDQRSNRQAVHHLARRPAGESKKGARAASWGRRSIFVVCELRGTSRAWQVRKSRPPYRRLDSLKASPQAGLPAPQIALFHGVSRAEGPSQQTTKNDGLPRIAASRKRCWRFSVVVAGASKAAGGLTIRRRLKTCPTIRRGAAEV
jgi:hypothetical protein